MDGEITHDALMRSAMKLIKEARASLRSTPTEHIASTREVIRRTQAILKRIDDDLKRHGVK